ncbi:MAG: hypothetical protein IT278_04685 [Ignavibacteriaceae bacterium]|nr:hypothetical protein [Ignavibacteriaceae bacterium]
MKAKILLPIVLFAFWATGCYTQFEAQQQPKVEKEVVIVERETEPDIVVNEGDTTFVYDDENESEVEISVKKYTYIEDDYWSRPVVRVNLIAGYGYGYGYGWNNFCYDPYWDYFYNPYVYYPRWVYYPWYWYDPYPFYWGGYHSYGYNYHHNNNWNGFSNHKYRDREISSIRGRDGGRGSSITRGNGSGVRTPGITNHDDNIAKRAGIKNDGSRGSGDAVDKEIRTERKRSAFDTWNRDEEPAVKRNSGRDVTKKDDKRSSVKNDGRGDNSGVDKRSGDRTDGNNKNVTPRKDTRNDGDNKNVTPRKDPRNDGGKKTVTPRKDPRNDGNNSGGKKTTREPKKDVKEP